MTTTTPAWRLGFIERLEAALPIDDLVGWLIQEYPDATERDVLGMVQAVYERDYAIAPAAPSERTYEMRDTSWKACPQRVARCGE